MEKNKLKVCILASGYPRYKDDFTNNFVHNLAKELVKKGLEIHVVAPHDVGTQVEEVMEGVKVHRFQYWFTKKGQKVAYGSGIHDNFKASLWAKIQIPFFIFFFFIKGFKVAKKCDLINAMWVPSGFISLFIGKIVRRKKKIPIYLFLLGGGIRFLPKKFSKYILKRVDLINTIGQPLLTELATSVASRKKIVNIPLIYESERVSSSDLAQLKNELGIENEKVVLYLARFTGDKAPLLFVKAIPLVIQKYTRIKFVMVGDGPLMGKLRAEIKRLNIDEHVILTGFRNDRFRFYALADIFVNLTPVENMWSSTIIECTLMGVPCILSDTKYTSKFLRNGFDFIIVKNEGKEVANAILSLIDDENKRKYIATNALNTIRKYKFMKDEAINETIRIYKNLINEKRKES